MPPYLAINPGLFDSVDHWSYRDLQKLAKRINVQASGKREEVVERLKAWHREQRSCGQVGQFHAVQVKATPEGKAIDPKLLSPLVVNSARTPSGILSTGKKSARGSCSERAFGASPMPLQQRAGVLFSPVRRAAPLDVLRPAHSLRSRPERSHRHDASSPRSIIW